MLQRDSQFARHVLAVFGERLNPGYGIVLPELPPDGERLFILPLKPVQLGKE